MKSRKSKSVTEMTKQEWDYLIRWCWWWIENGDDPFHWTYWFWIEYYHKLFGNDGQTSDKDGQKMSEGA